MTTEQSFWHDVFGAMARLDFTSDDELEVVIGGTQIYEIEGAGTRWSPAKGTRKYNSDAFLVIRRKQPVISSVPTNEQESECN